MTKKTIDAVKMMREAREKLSRDWEGKPDAEISYLRKKYSAKGTLKKKKTASL